MLITFMHGRERSCITYIVQPFSIFLTYLIEICPLEDTQHKRGSVEMLHPIRQNGKRFCFGNYRYGSPYFPDSHSETVMQHRCKHAPLLTFF